jgi:hypothetical protein
MLTDGDRGARRRANGGSSGCLKWIERVHALRNVRLPEYSGRVLSEPDLRTKSAFWNVYSRATLKS